MLSQETWPRDRACPRLILEVLSITEQINQMEKVGVTKDQEIWSLYFDKIEIHENKADQYSGQAGISQTDEGPNLKLKM